MTNILNLSFENYSIESQLNFNAAKFQNMLFYEGRIIYKENEYTACFIGNDSQNYVFIIIGKTLEDTFKELTKNRAISHGTKIKVNGDVGYYAPTDDDVLFCYEFELLE